MMTQSCCDSSKLRENFVILVFRQVYTVSLDTAENFLVIQIRDNWMSDEARRIIGIGFRFFLKWVEYLKKTAQIRIDPLSHSTWTYIVNSFALYDTTNTNCLSNQWTVCNLTRSFDRSNDTALRWQVADGPSLALCAENISALLYVLYKLVSSIATIVHWNEDCVW